VRRPLIEREVLQVFEPDDGLVVIEFLQGDVVAVELRLLPAQEEDERLPRRIERDPDTRSQHVAGTVADALAHPPECEVLSFLPGQEVEEPHLLRPIRFLSHPGLAVFGQVGKSRGIDGQRRQLVEAYDNPLQETVVPAAVVDLEVERVGPGAVAAAPERRNEREQVSMPHDFGCGLPLAPIRPFGEVLQQGELGFRRHRSDGSDPIERQAVGPYETDELTPDRQPVLGRRRSDAEQQRNDAQDRDVMQSSPHDSLPADVMGDLTSRRPVRLTIDAM